MELCEDVLENGVWQKKSMQKTVTPNGEAGYVFVSDIHPITNQDVTADGCNGSRIRQLGSNDEYKNENGACILTTECIYSIWKRTIV